VGDWMREWFDATMVDPTIPADHFKIGDHKFRIVGPPEAPEVVEVEHWRTLRLVVSNPVPLPDGDDAKD
jgi:hypothetical protein